LFRQSASHWSRLADRAAEIADDFGPVTELAVRRIGVAMTHGREGAEQIRALSEQISALEPPPPDADLLAELADLVDAARSVEQQAVTLLSR
jgi:hypothetical protein